MDGGHDGKPPDEGEARAEADFLEECERQGKLPDFLEAVRRMVCAVLCERGIRIQAEDEEDIRQHTILLARQLGGPVAAEGPWPILYGHTRNALNECLSRRESGRRIQRLDDEGTPEPVDPRPGPAERIDRRETCEARNTRFQAWLGSLPTAQRQVFEEVELGRRKVADVAVALGLSETAVWASLKRARQDLRRHARQIRDGV
jgi:DNA-directed RNA polymerase specialized sigma24 family protein